MAISLLKITSHYESRAREALCGKITPQRFLHIETVNNAFRAFVQGNYGQIFFMLPDNLRAQTDFDHYAKTLAGVRESFRSLTDADQRDFAAAVVLHDVGYLEDQGVGHPETGAKIVGNFVQPSGLYGVNRLAVSEIVSNHGFYSDISSNLLPRDAEEFLEARKTQFLLITMLDAMGKPSGSALTQTILDYMIMAREGKFLDPELFYNFRLRSLLGPAIYSSLSSESFALLLLEIDKLPKEEKEELYKNVAFRFRNLCWPVFQEIGLKKGNIKAFLYILRRASTVASLNFPDGKDVYLYFEPDFFSLTPEKRKPYLDTATKRPETITVSATTVKGKSVVKIKLRVG